MKTKATLPNIAAGVLVLTLVGQLFFLPVTNVAAEIDQNVIIDAGRGAGAEVSASCHDSLRLRAAVSLVRAGSDNTFARRRIQVDLINPSGQIADSLTTEIGHDSNMTVNGQNGTASNRYLLTAPAALGGTNCSSWKVKLRDAEAGITLLESRKEIPVSGPSSQQITGKVQFYTVGQTTATIAAPPKFGIEQSGTIERNVSIPFTGDLTLQANWDTDEFSWEPYNLTFSLINTHGRVVSTNTGCSRDSIEGALHPTVQMKISYRATCADFGGSQSWKIRVLGSSKGKVKNVDLKASITDGLF
jgi:hypothetical protein